MVLTACSAGDEFPTLKGAYLGQQFPESAPRLFAPGAVSTGLDELAPCWSPDEKSFVFSVQMPGHARHPLLEMRLENGEWTAPEVLPFSGLYSDADAVYAPNGRRLFFTAKRPQNVGGGSDQDWDIWYVDKTLRGWGEPINPGPPINSEGLDTYPSFTDDGTLYFCSNRVGGFGGLDVYRFRVSDGSYSEPENLGEPLNSIHTEDANEPLGADQF